MEITKAEMRALKMNMAGAMDTYIRNLNDEDAMEEWLMEGVPDGADEEDLAWFADNLDEWIDLCNLFGKLVKRYGKYGEAV